MGIYIFLLFFLLFSSISKKWAKNIYILIPFLIIPLGIRSLEVGTDTDTYNNVFESIRIYGRSYIEPMWFLLNKFVIILGGGFSSLMLIVSFLTIYPIVYIVNKESENPNLSLFIYYSLCFYGMAFNISRQILALSFVFVGYFYLNKGKTFKFALMVILASSFHISSIVSFAVYFFNKLNLTSKRIFMLLGSSLFFGTFLINDGVIGLFAGKYASYIMSSAGYRTSLLIPLVITIILNLLFTFIYIYSKSDIKIGLWFKIYLLSIIINNLSYTLILGSRLLLFFSIAQIIYFVTFIYNNRVKQKKVVVGVIMIYVLILFLRMVLTNGGEIVPYDYSFKLL
jgi:hypothetical protein